jgi:hypothetical protein
MVLETVIRDKWRRRSFAGPLCAGVCLAAVISVALGFGRADTANNGGSGSNSMSASGTDGGAEMDQAAKTQIFHDVLNKLTTGEKLDPELMKEFVSAQNADVQTGPKLGEKVPDFTLSDQDGRKHSLGDLTGANGLLLVFVRSADW